MLTCLLYFPPSRHLHPSSTRHLGLSTFASFSAVTQIYKSSLYYVALLNSALVLATKVPVIANHGTTYANVAAITEVVQKKLDESWIKIFNSFPTDYFCSSTGVTSKYTDGVQIGWHIIFDLFCLDRKSINNGISVSYGTIIYESLSMLMNLVV